MNLKARLERLEASRAYLSIGEALDLMEAGASNVGPANPNLIVFLDRLDKR